MPPKASAQIVYEKAKEALIKELVRNCNRDYVQNQDEKHSNTGSIASIFKFNKRFPN
jgi:hypothetical protein